MHILLDSGGLTYIYRKAQMGAGVISIIIAVVSLIIGLVIVNDIAVSTQHYTSVSSESHTLTAVPQNVTLNNAPIPAAHGVSITNGTGAIALTATNYTIYSRTDSIVEIDATYDNDTHGQEVEFTYEYEQAEYLDSSLSRTIVGYFVPIALLGALIIIAMVYVKRD